MQDVSEARIGVSVEEARKFTMDQAETQFSASESKILETVKSKCQIHFGSG
jgi:hypothetical protein